MGGILIALALDLIAFVFGVKLIHKCKHGDSEEGKKECCGLCKVCGYIVLVAASILFIFTFVGIILAAFGVGVCPGFSHMGPGMMQPGMMGGMPPCMGGSGMMGGMMQQPGMMQGTEMMKPPEGKTPETKPEEGKTPTGGTTGEPTKTAPETK